MTELLYTDVVWTAGDIISEAKMDNMVANDRAVDAMANGIRMVERGDPGTPPANNLHLYVKDKEGVATLYCLNDAGKIYELSENTPVYTLPVSGPVVVGTKVTNPLLITKDVLLTKAYAYCDNAPIGANLIIDISKNGQSIWNSHPANRLTIVDGAFSGFQTAFDTISFSEFDVVTMDILQVGANISGSNLTVHLKFK